MRGLWRAILLALIPPLACGGAAAGLLVMTVYLAIPQLPAWAQGPTASWMLGEPQETLGGAVPAPVPIGVIPLDGYAGPESFACLLPPVYGYLTDRYGTLRPGGWIHNGIDYGTYYQPVDVRTPFGGKVVFSGLQGAYGSLIVIENAGYQVYLAHNQEIYAPIGRLVSAGEVVALSGNTGNSSGYHVHFEVRIWDGAAWISVDPNAVQLPGQAEFCDWYALGEAQTP